MDGDKDRPPGWVEFEVKETSLDEEESLKKTSNCGQTKTTTMPKIDPLSLNEIPLNDEEGGLSQSSKPDGSVAFTKTNGHASSDNQKGVAKLQMSSQNAIQSAQTILNGAKHSSTNNNHKNSEVIVGVGHTNGGSVGEPKSFKTGKVLTSVYPTNLRCAWLAPPEYDPTKMPKILSHEQIHLDPATYVDIMKCITGDIRFNSDPFIQMLIDCRDAHASGDELDYSILYDENSDNQSEDNEPPHSRYQDINKAIEYGFVSVCRNYCVMYSRVLPVWVLLSILVLLIVLFSSPSGGLPVMIFTFIWMFMLLLGIFFCVIIRKHLAIALRQAVKDANKLAFDHKLLVGVQDRGQLSCHKVVILFIYYDEIGGCQEDLARLLRVHQANAITAQARPTSMSETESGELAAQLLLQYSQQYVKMYMKKQLLFPTRPIEGVSDFRPKHQQKSFCMCQFIEKSHISANQKKTWYEKLV